MVSSLILSPAFADQLNKHINYDLYCISPVTYIGRIIPFGRIWWMRGKQKWGTTLTNVHTAYLDVRVENRTIAVMYVENGAVLKLTWKDIDTPRI